MGFAAISNLSQCTSPDEFEKQADCQGGTQLRAVREPLTKAPGRGRWQGAWADRAVILKETLLSKGFKVERSIIR